MDKEKVIKILEFYSDIDGHIKTYKALLGDLEDYYHPLGAMNYDGLPKGINNVSHITENTALNIPDFVHEDIKYYEAKIDELFQLKTEILKEVSKLEYRHKTIIFDFYLNKMKWEQVSSRNNYSERQCKNIRNEALEKLDLRFSQNRVISKFKVAA
jgi:hypothetical protein